MGSRRDRGHWLAHPTVRNWEKVSHPESAEPRQRVIVEMGWGRLIFGHTFDSLHELAAELRDEAKGRRDIALYLRDPHVVLSLAPQELFLDPSHTYRLWRHQYRPLPEPVGASFSIRRIKTRQDAEDVNRIYEARGMVKFDEKFVVDNYANRKRTYWIAVDNDNNDVLATVTGVDHVEAFEDPENGTSLWCLAVDPQAQAPGLGEALVRQLAEHYFARGRDYVDLSVMHDNKSAIMLYEKLGFQRVPVFCLKRKNPINEPLFVAPPPDGAQKLNPYAEIIVNEARLRGIFVDVVDADLGLFDLTLGGRSVRCRESLTDQASAIAMTLCDDKRFTHRCLKDAGLRVPDQIEAAGKERSLKFLEKHGSVVVKPARGEQGIGVHVGVSDPEDVVTAIEEAGIGGSPVILEEMVSGQDLRVIVIDGEVVAAALRKPPELVGTGRHTISQLLDKYNRRRRKATGGESSVPSGPETEKCVAEHGYDMEDVLPAEERITVRKTANLHTGGTIHDVTAKISSELRRVSVAASEALGMPVVGLDLAVPDVEGDTYAIIEANERPGLANHEPAPTAQKFIDYLFPQSVTNDPA